jgi:hypothetical protein
VPFSALLLMMQHGDGYSTEYTAGLPQPTRDIVRGLFMESPSIFEASAFVSVCHSEPGAWHPAMYSTARCPPPGARFTVGRTMFEVRASTSPCRPVFRLICFLYALRFFVCLYLRASPCRSLFCRIARPHHVTTCGGC